GDAGQRAILAGDNSGRPRLLFLGGKTSAALGDRVVTSGDGEAFPPSLPVGQVVRVDDGIVEVEPYVARSKLQYVRIVEYGLSGILPALPGEE
ncbi:MAG: rod shape-determining protein MreC, partial [Rhodospirillaceae bacterium]